MKTSGRFVDICDLSSDDRRQMLQLMERHYLNVVPAEFETDLTEKQWVIQVRGPHGELCGFSTQMVLDFEVEGHPMKALFSGDTIIDQRYWGDSALMRAGGQLAISLIDRYPEAELFWFLISQGYKTYRFLPVFFREFYPRYDASTPASVRAVIDVLAKDKFPSRYDAVAGIVPHGRKAIQTS